MKRTLAGSLAAITIITALAFASAAPATAADLSDPSSTGTPRTLAAIQAAGATATSTRIAALNRAIPRITANKCVTDADKATILATFAADLTAMQGLATTIAADTDVATAGSHYRSIFQDYRVFEVAIAQAHYAAAADCITGKALPALISAQSKLTAALAGKHADKATPEVEAAMADLAAQIAAAQSAIGGVAATALAVTPADYNANHAVLRSSKASLSTAVAAIKLARQDVKKVVDALR